MNGFSRRTERKKQDIRQAALVLLKEFDPKSIKITDIAKKAKVSQVTIYNHFTSKKLLFREVIIDYILQNVEGYESFLRSGRPLKEKIEFIILNKKKTIQQIPPEFFQQLINEDDQIRHFVDEIYRGRILPLLIEIVKEAQQKDEIAPHFSIDALLLFLNALKVAGEDLHRKMYNIEEWELIAEELVLLFFYGVKGERVH